MQDSAYYFSQLEKELLFYCVSGKSLVCKEPKELRKSASSFFRLGTTCHELNNRILQCWKDILSLVIQQRTMTPPLFDLKFHWTNPCSPLVLNWIDGTPNFTKMNINPNTCKVGFVINPDQKLEIFGLDKERPLWTEIDKFEESTVELAHTLAFESDSHLAPPLYECRGSLLFVSNGFSGIDIFNIKTKALLGTLKEKGNHFIFNNCIKPLIYENYVFVLYTMEFKNRKREPQSV